MAAPSAPVVRAKLVMVGAPGVGKTSLVRRFVHSIFSDEYHSTLGVKVDRKIVVVERATVTMLLWDMHGETEGLDVPDHYLRGATASVAVFDATRLETIAVAADLQRRVKNNSPRAFQVSVANKADLRPNWNVVDRERSEIPNGGTFRTSAKTGEGVDDMFHAVAIGIRDAMESRQSGG